MVMLADLIKNVRVKSHSYINAYYESPWVIPCDRNQSGCCHLLDF